VWRAEVVLQKKDAVLHSCMPELVSSWTVLPWWQLAAALASAGVLAVLQPDKLSFFLDTFTAFLHSDNGRVQTRAPCRTSQLAVNDKVLGDRHSYPSHEQVVCDILVALIGISLLYSVIHLCRSFTLRSTLSVAESGTPLNISLEFGSAVIMSPIFFAVYAMGAIDMYGSLEERWGMTTRNTYSILVLHCAADILGSILFVGLQKKEKLLYVHHLLTVTIYSQAAMSGRGHFYCCMASTVELTNIFLFVITCGPSLGIKPGSLFHTICGALLWVTFTLFRMLLLPGALLLYAVDVWSNPSDTLPTLPPLLCAVQWPGGVIVFLLSTFWYYKITKGLTKALNLGGDKAKKGQ